MESNIVANILGVIFSIWFINLMIDFLFGINVIGYLKLWIELKLSKGISDSDEDHDDDEDED